MASKLEHLRALAERLPTSDGESLDWDWDSCISFRDGLITEGILNRRPPSTHHVRELARLAVGQSLQAPRTVAARWAQRTATQLSQEPYTAQ